MPELSSTFPYLSVGAKSATPSGVTPKVLVVSKRLGKADRKSTRLNSTHRDLHSFPTRRSSDLRAIEHVSILISRREISNAIRCHTKGLSGIEAVGQSRSEEHTSELHSPRSSLFPYTTLFRSPSYRARFHTYQSARNQQRHPVSHQRS